MHTELETLVLTLQQQPTREPAMPVTVSNSHTYPPIHNLPVRDLIHQKLASYNSLKCEGDQNAFFIGDLGEVYRQHLRWKALLPRIEPFFGKNMHSS